MQRYEKVTETTLYEVLKEKKSLQLTATAFLWVVAQVLLVGVEPVAPARQLVEVALHVALIVVVECAPLWYSCHVVDGVIQMVQQTDAQRVVVEMFLAVVHIAIVDESLLEGVVQRGRDGLQLGIAGLLGQQLGIVGNVEEGFLPFEFQISITPDRLDTIHALGSTVDGLLLCGIECQCNRGTVLLYFMSGTTT